MTGMKYTLVTVTMLCYDYVVNTLASPFGQKMRRERLILILKCVVQFQILVSNMFSNLIEE